MSSTNSEGRAVDKESVLQEAARLVEGGDRRQQYGGPFDSFSDIAKGWSMVFGIDVTPEQVALAMIVMKVARAKNGFHRDSIVDIAGYARCAEFIQEARAEQSDVKSNPEKDVER